MELFNRGIVKLANRTNKFTILRIHLFTYSHIDYLSNRVTVKLYKQINDLTVTQIHSYNCETA